MPRPCVADHRLSPRSCRACHWCLEPSPKGKYFRQLWDEPEPDGGTPPPRELIPGLLDPIPAPVLREIPPRWAFDPGVIRKHQAALQRLVTGDIPPPPHREGQGVLLVGGGKYWPGIVVAVRMLRDTGSRLPIQIWHRGAAEMVKPADLAGIPDVEIHDLTKLSPAPRVLGGWEAKTVAILASGWERIFYLDADAYTVANPQGLLDKLSPKAPFLFWRDLQGGGEPVNWTAWGRTSSPVPPIQGGHLALHVPHFWRELVISHWLNQHSDFTYRHQYGDQDSWRVSLTATGGRYVCLGQARWENIAFVCDLDDAPFVVHRCQSKMLFSEDVLPEDRHSNRRLPRLPGEQRAWDHFDALVSSRPAAEVFGTVYARGLWGPAECSGVGSTVEQARAYIDLINGLIRVAGWRKVVDLGCGDGVVGSRLRAPDYVGVDCHAPHIYRSRERFPDREWLRLDLDRERDKLPCGDLVLVKDVFHHWPNALVTDWLTWARASGKWRWLICTQDCQQEQDGADCPLGGYRPLSVTRPPLSGLGLMPLCEYLNKSVLLLPLS